MNAHPAALAITTTPAVTPAALAARNAISAVRLATLPVTAVSRAAPDTAAVTATAAAARTAAATVAVRRPATHAAATATWPVTAPKDRSATTVCSLAQRLRIYTTANSLQVVRLATSRETVQLRPRVSVSAISASRPVTSRPPVLTKRPN